MNEKTKRIVTAALLAALACIATMVIKIPSPLKGYVNLGDCIVLVAGWMLAPKYGFLAAGIGSALADVFLGYVLYAPATLVIKGSMALVAYYGCRLLGGKGGGTVARIVSGVAAEAVMVLGYLLFESCLYGFMPSLVNVPANGMQGVAGVVIGVVLMKVLEKSQHAWEQR